MLLLMLPYFANEEGMEIKNYWNYEYILDDLLLMIVYLPFILLWVVFLTMKPNSKRKFLVYILLIYSFILFIIVLGDYLLGELELLPITGRQISMLIFPLIGLYCIILNRMSKTAPKMDKDLN